MAGNDVFGVFTASPRSGPGLRRSDTTHSDRGFAVRDASPTRGRSFYHDSYDGSRSRRFSSSSHNHRSSSTHSDREYHVRHASPTRGRSPYRDPYIPFTPRPYGSGFGEGLGVRNVSPIRRERRSSSTYSHHSPFTAGPSSGYGHGQGAYPATPRREHRSSSTYSSRDASSFYDVRDVSPTRGRHRSRRDSYHSDDGFDSGFDTYNPFGAQRGFPSSPSHNTYSSSGPYAGSPKYKHDSHRPRRKPNRLTVEELPDHVTADHGSQKLYEYAGTEDPDGEKLSDGGRSKSGRADGYSRNSGYGRGRAF
jgi:hypothetical protein